MTLAELIQECPSASLTLFSRFGVGSRDKLGFRPEQQLHEVLSRYLVFDVDAVLRTVRETHSRQQRWIVPVAPESGAVLVDCRSRREFEAVPVTGALYLDGDTARKLLEQRPRAIFFCQTGSLSAAAAEHFAGKGLEVGFWERGLAGWRELHPTFPDSGAQAEDRADRLRILAHDGRARMLAEPVPPGELWDYQGVLPAGLRVWRQREFLVVENDGSVPWPDVQLELDGGEWRQTRLDSGQLEDTVRATLRDVVNPTLSSHKGEVVLLGMQDEVARLQLSGGCQGCSSAAITVSQEIAGHLMRASRELLGVEDATDHEAPNDEKPAY